MSMKMAVNKKFKKVVILDSVILYPEHRKVLESLAGEIVEYPSSLPDRLEEQYAATPDLFKNIKCYTELGADNTSAQLLMNRIDGADVVISCWTGIPDEVLKLNPQLKLIIFWTHEKEHRINLKLAEVLGMTVTNIPDYGTDSVSEAVFAGLFKVWEKNYQSDQVTRSQATMAQAVMAKIFHLYRQLANNEKYTRSGKFTHHFHKLGLINFDFNKKSLDELIPEHLVECKNIGLLNINNPELDKMLAAFNIDYQEFTLTDSNLATYYKFISTNEYIIYDSQQLAEQEVKKLSLLAQDKIIDIQSLAPIDYDVKGKIFGVIGLGRIGQKVAKLAHDLGFEVLYYSKTAKPELAQVLGTRYGSLEEVISQSDVVSLHVPAYKAEGLIDKNLINLLKSKAIFINTADGNAIDQASLSKRMLANEIIAYLDVYQGLPRKDIMGLAMADPADWKLKKVLANHVLAYRVGWKTQESIRVKTYKMLGELIDYKIDKHDSYVLPEEL